MSARKRKKIGRAGFYVFFTVITLLIIFPIYWMLVTSLQSNAEYLARPPILVPTINAITAYMEYIRDSDVLIWMRNTVAVGVVVVVFTTLVAVPAAHAISRFKFRGRSVATFSILVTQMLPLTFILIPVFIIFSRIGFVNNLAVLMVIDSAFVLPVSIWFLKGFCDAIPMELWEAALLDGCSPFQALLRVIIPILRPGIAATATWALIIVWDEFLFARTFINSSNLFTFSVGISSYIGQYDTIWNALMRGSFISTLPVAILFIFFQKHLVGGLTGGAVKG